ncbi:tetratricopeptide repeat protein [Kordiimonas sp.]|uniref:tetratricopeptide repeat protein n=1 Tax=Kordiimonas sp. TaxID=1970157 RepID=UPI003A936BF8
MKRNIVPYIRKAQNFAASGDMGACREQCVKAWSLDRLNPDNLVAVCTTLIDAGQDELALDILGEAVTLQGETEALCSIMGEMALRMNLPHVAEKAYAKACEHNPAEPSHILHLAKAYELLERQDDAVQLLQTSLQMFSQYAAFWNALGMLINLYTSDLANSRIFLQEGIRLRPDVADYHHNLALTFHDQPPAEPHYREALRLAPRNSQIKVSYGIYLLQRMRPEEAWPYYEARLDPELGDSKVAQYDHGVRAWKGQSLEGKSIFVYAEQGIGDEVFFSLFLPRLLDMGARVHVGCDPRLTGLYERSFPGVAAYGFDDVKNFRYRVRRFPGLHDWMKTNGSKVDFSVAVGSLPYRLGLTLDDIRSTEGHIFTPEPSRLEELRKYIVPGKRPKIAVSWRSSNISGVRRFYYLGLDYVKALSSAVDADFYVLQYSYTDAERAELGALDNIHFFDDLDLKQDIEANIAILSMMDASVGPPTATQMFAQASGTPIFLVNNGPPWTSFGAALAPPRYKEGSRFIHTRSGVHFKSNEQLVADIKASLEELA